MQRSPFDFPQHGYPSFGGRAFAPLGRAGRAQVSRHWQDGCTCFDHTAGHLFNPMARPTFDLCLVVFIRCAGVDRLVGCQIELG